MDRNVVWSIDFVVPNAAYDTRNLATPCISCSQLLQWDVSITGRAWEPSQLCKEDDRALLKGPEINVTMSPSPLPRELSSRRRGV